MKKNRKTVFIYVVLSILVIMSFVCLFSTLKPYIVKDTNTVIELIPDKKPIDKEENTKPNSESKTDDEEVWKEDVFNSNNDTSGQTIIYEEVLEDYDEEYLIYPEPTILSEEEIQAYDDVQIWTTSTDIDIFSLKPDEVNIVSSNGEKIIAPGSENDYRFYIKNNGASLLHYDVEFLSFFDQNTTNIPVDIKLKKDGNYILGDDTSYVHVKQLDGLNDNGTLSLNNISNYELLWKWSYEGNDALDSSLGNRVVNEDVTLTIQINTKAEAVYDDPDPIVGHRPGKRPVLIETIINGVNTGDEFNLALYGSIFAASFVMLILLLKKKDKDEDSKTDI